MLLRRKNQFSNTARSQTNSTVFRQNRLYQQIQETEELPTDVLKIRSEVDQYCFQLLKGIQNNFPSESILPICEKLVLFLRLADSEFLRDLAHIFRDQGDVGLFLEVLRAHPGDSPIAERVTWILVQLFHDENCNASFVEYPFFDVFRELLRDNRYTAEVARNVG